MLDKSYILIRPALLALLLLSDSFRPPMTHSAAAAPAVGTDPPTTPAPHASGLSNSLPLISLVHMLATFTLVALYSPLFPLYYYT
jgi:hypothetical protein